MKKAFTLLELIFVIVVIGILVAVILPKTRTNPLEEATQKLLSYIKYTQHLSLIDDKYDKLSPNWYKKRWQLQINNNELSIVSDINTSYAKNPSNTKKLLKNINFLNEYTVTISPGTIISFDYLGRPYSNIQSINGSLLTNNYSITISDGNSNGIITIHPETGYTNVTYN